MKKKTYQSVCSLILLAASLSWTPSASGQPLRLDIGLSDTTYYVCQPIWLDAQLTNISADSVRIRGLQFPGGDLLNIVLTDENADTLKPVYQIAFLDWPGILLYPQETYYESFDLAYIFHNHEVVPEFAAFQWTPSLAPGKYRVSAEYPLGGKWIKTPEITFEVVEPTETEQEAFELYIEAYKHQKRKAHSLAEQQLKKLVTDYPKSAYAERAYVRLHLYEELLEKCPQSGYLAGHLRTAIAKIAEEDKQRFLEKVIKEHPKTRSARFADQLLRNLKRKE